MGLITLAVLEKLEAKYPGHPCVDDLFQVFYNCRGRRKEPVFHAGW